MTLLWVVLLFAAGATLILLEFVLPGAVLGILGAGLIVASCVYGVMTMPDLALFIIVGEVAASMAVVLMGLWLLSNTKAGGLLKLETAMSNEEGWENAHTDASLVGRAGVVITALRPAGIVDIDGRRLDVTSDADFIEAGAPVRVVRVSGNYILVERAPAPAELPGEPAPGH